MSTKPLPPGRPPGSLDLLDPESSASPRDGESAEDWRADALGRSRHSRLASEIREPLDDANPESAERLCAEIARNTLGDFAPALLLLSSERRRRVQALSAWTVALFDLALRPGLAGLDGDRLAQINAWEFRTEEALAGQPPGQPVFVMMADLETSRPWAREALDEIGAIARRMALTSRPGHRAVSTNDYPSERRAALALDRAIPLGRALASALLVHGSEEPPAIDSLGRLLGASIELAAQSADARRTDAGSLLLERLESVRVAEIPHGWRRAAQYTRRAAIEVVRRGPDDRGLGLAARLRLLALSFIC